MMLIFEIPKLKDEIARGEKESAKVGSDPGLIWELKQNRALLAMIKGYCKWGTNESVIKALDKHLSKKKSGPKKNHTLIFGKAMKDCDKKLKKKSTSDEIWTHLKEHLRSKYDPDENIISTMHLNEMLIIKSSGNDESLEKESFARAIRRLRKDTHS